MDILLEKKVYKVSRIILAAIAFIVFNIMFINADTSWKIIPPFFALITFAISFPSSIISKKLIFFTNKMDNKVVKALFYIIAMPAIIFAFFLVLYFIIIFVFNMLPTPNELGPALSQALLALFIITVGTICLIVPYIQTIIVLILKKFMEKGNN